MNKLECFLSEHPLFSPLSVVERKEVVTRSIRRRYGKGEVIAHYAETWPYLLIVEEGAIHGLKESREGRSLIVMALEAGDLFWGLAFFEEEALMPVMLRAQKSSSIWIWRREHLLPMLLANGRFSWELSRLMARRMQRASEIVEELAFQPVRGRLARLLLDQFGDVVDQFVARDLTLDEMAAHVGTKREMICRLLYQFADEGAIEISRTEFMLTDYEKLKDYALSAKS